MESPQDGTYTASQAKTETSKGTGIAYTPLHFTYICMHAKKNADFQILLLKGRGNAVHKHTYDLCKLQTLTSMHCMTINYTL